MNNQKTEPKIILVGGGSCSGKSTLAKNIFRELSPSTFVERISIDDYYKDLADRDSVLLNDYNFDSPEAIDSNLLFTHMQTLLAGKHVKRQHYDFKTHSISYPGTDVNPATFIIVEGIFALYYKELRKMAAASIFLESPADIRLIKRIKRDRAERGLDVDLIIRQYCETVRPMHELYVASSIKYADLIVDSGKFDEVTNLKKAMHFLSGKFNL
jgi:uridine kinase